jgi:hypothetical protein
MFISDALQEWGKAKQPNGAEMCVRACVYVCVPCLVCLSVLLTRAPLDNNPRPHMYI